MLDLHCRLGHRDGVAAALHAYAELYVASRDDPRAATLLAATESYRLATGVPPTPTHALVLDRLHSRLASRASLEDIADAVARGRRMSAGAAIALASAGSDRTLSS